MSLRLKFLIPIAGAVIAPVFVFLETVVLA